jgi:hypothetical protein
MPLTSQTISESERALLERRGRPGWLQRLFQPRANADVLRDIETGIADQLEGAVEQAFKTKTFSEVMPQYVIQIGQNVLVLSGQWIYDSTLNQTDESWFEKWDVNSLFPASIFVRIARNSGMALAFRATDERTIPLSVLPVFGPLRLADEARVYPLDQGDTVKTLQNAGLIG